jgi:hypothetical protein
MEYQRFREFQELRKRYEPEVKKVNPYPEAATGKSAKRVAGTRSRSPSAKKKKNQKARDVTMEEYEYRLPAFQRLGKKTNDESPWLPKPGQPKGQKNQEDSDDE